MILLQGFPNRTAVHIVEQIESGGEGGDDESCQWYLVAADTVDSEIRPHSEGILVTPRHSLSFVKSLVPF